MNKSKQFLTIARICQLYHRQLSSQVTEKVAPRFSKLKTAQKKYQIDDGTPVYIKSGFGDKILYNGTFLLSLVGVGLSLETFIRLVFK